MTDKDSIDKHSAEEELKKIFDLSIDMICIADINGFFKKINNSFVKTLGYTAEELLAKPFLDFVHPDDKDSTIAVINEKLANGTAVFNFRNRYRCKDGTYKWLLWTSNPTPGTGLTYAIARDITERIKAENELKSTKELLRRSIDGMLEGYGLHEALFDDKGVMVDYRFLEFNRAAQKIAGITREDIVGKTALALYPHIVERGIMNKYADVMATGTPTYIEDFYYEGDNLNKALDISCFRLDDKHFVCVFRDITERKISEEELLVRNKEIERINKAFVGRELKMVELKKEMKELRKNQKS